MARNSGRGVRKRGRYIFSSAYQAQLLGNRYRVCFQENKPGTFHAELSRHDDPDDQKRGEHFRVSVTVTNVRHWHKDKQGRIWKVSPSQ